MTAEELLAFDEQLVVACILYSPTETAWELDGLAPDLFRPGPLRVIVEAICATRDGRGPHFWVGQVVRALHRSGRRMEARFARDLVRSVGTSWGMTPSMSRLYQARAARAVRGAA